MPNLRPCSECFRHVLITEASCPFCSATLLVEAERRRPESRGRVSRAALVALGTLAVTPVVACGGKAEEERNSGDGDISGDGGMSGDGDMSGDGGTSGDGDVVAPPYGLPPQSGGASSVGAGGAPVYEGPSYRPETDVDFVGDGRFIEGGSVERGQGFGFDTCYFNPGVSVEEGSAAEGDFFVAFRSTDMRETDHDGAVAQAAFFSEEAPLLAGVPLYVYFEIRNLSDVPPTGELSLAPVDFCELYEPKTTVDLFALETGPEWDTRCIEIIPQQEQTWLGISVTGEDFAIGIDAVRLGPPCN